MKKYITSLAVIATLLTGSFNSYGQDIKQEFSISAGGPFSFMKYSGGYVAGNGFNAGLRYSYYLNEGLSLGIGVEYQSYSSDFTSTALNGSYNTVDSENEAFQFRYRTTNFREEQNLGYINIPLNIQFETPGTSKLYVAAGAKIGFAVNGCYTTTMQNLTTSGYYPQYNVELFSPEFAGFFSKNNVDIGKQDLETEISYSFTFETGLKQLIGKHSAFYIGAYLDYGLNNIYDKGSNKPVVQYSPELPVQLQYNSALDSQFVHDVRLVSYGIKLRFAVH
ncbi:hypothetical protein ACFFLS_13120 [Flavobacterium procerum]|uniref:Outer membrane protein beta-barrel domain-containing protein n=1 Tax=Flavobacterium procerum TaxID=1455569 RepID=A0ABV6BRD2_9FLAO